MSSAVGAQAVNLHIPGIFEGYDSELCDREGLTQEVSPGGDINFPWLIQQSAMIGNAATTGMFFNPRYFDPEIGYDAVGINQNWPGAAGRNAVGGLNIWW